MPKTASHVSRSSTVVCGLLLFVAVLAVFLPACRNGFINYDDDVYVTDNLQVQAGLTRSSFAWAWCTFHAGNWHPLTWLSHMLDCELFRLDPAGHHFTSVLLHAANTMLLFFVLRRLTRATWPSFFASALFGLHPLRVESVAWVAERKDVLSGLFFMLTLWAWVRWKCEGGSAKEEVQSPKSKVQSQRSEVQGSWFWYSAALGFYALGLMSKPMLVTLPFVLLLLDMWPLRRWPCENGRQLPVRLLLEKAPFFLLAAAACVVTWLAQRHGGAVESLARLPLSARVENALVAYGRYLGKTFWPSNLAVFYPRPGHWPMWEVGLGLLLVIAVSVLAWRLRTSRPYYIVGWLWFLGTLVPVVGLMQVGFQSLADRYTYLPSIGLYIAVVWGVREAVLKRSPIAQLKLALIGLSTLVLLGALCWRQLSFWKDSGTLFGHALEVTRANPIAELHFGSFELLDPKRVDQALPHLQAAIELEPRFAESHDALGTALYLKGHRPEAIRQFEQAIALKPDYAVAHFNLAVVLQAEGQLSDALQQFEQALAARPDYAEACNGMGVVLAAQGKLDAATERFQQALALNPNLPTVHYNLGLALLKQGRRVEAAAHFARALALRPGYPEAQRQLDALNH